MLYQEVLNSGEPDAVYEFFWYNFKASVTNFTSANTDVKAKVPVVSQRLNRLKAEKKYDDIIVEINTFLVDFLWSSVSILDSEYHLDIASTNIKRWLNLPKIKEEPPADISTLKVIYSIVLKHKEPEVKQMLMNARGQFDRDRIVSHITRYCYRRTTNEGCSWALNILTKLTQEPVTQPIVVKTLRSLNVNVPDTIRSCAKLISKIQ